MTARANENTKDHHREILNGKDKANDNQLISQSKKGYEAKTKTEVTVTVMFCVNSLLFDCWFLAWLDLKLSKRKCSRVSE